MSTQFYQLSQASHTGDGSLHMCNRPLHTSHGSLRPIQGHNRPCVCCKYLQMVVNWLLQLFLLYFTQLHTLQLFIHLILHSIIHLLHIYNSKSCSQSVNVLLVGLVRSNGQLVVVKIGPQILNPLRNRLDVGLSFPKSVGSLIGGSAHPITSVYIKNIYWLQMYLLKVVTHFHTSLGLKGKV